MYALFRHDLALFQRFHKQDTDHQTGDALNTVCRNIRCGRNESVQKTFEYEISEHHKNFSRGSADHSGSKISQVLAEYLKHISGAHGHKTFDHKGSRRIHDVTGKNICQCRANTGGEKTICRRKHPARSQYHAVAQIQISFQRRRDRNDHRSDTGKRRHQC